MNTFDYTSAAKSCWQIQDSLRGIVFDRSFLSLSDSSGSTQIKCSGHATSPRISSSGGLLIYLSRFDGVEYDTETKLLHVGGGALWEHAYSEAMKNGRGLIGGSISEGVGESFIRSLRSLEFYFPGVGGWLLGGGYSLKSNRYGLGIDNIKAYDLILPSGENIVVTDKAETNTLFQALKVSSRDLISMMILSHLIIRVAGIILALWLSSPSILTIKALKSM